MPPKPCCTPGREPAAELLTLGRRPAPGPAGAAAVDPRRLGPYATSSPCRAGGS